MKVTVKKSRTRFIAIAVALICTLSLTACNSNGTSSQTESSNTVNSSVSADSSTDSSGSNNSYEAWSDEIVLSNIIPEVKGTVDYTYENTEEKMWIDFDSVDDNQYKDYITACKDRGFTVEEESDSYKFEAFNGDGYKLELTHFSGDDGLSVILEAPRRVCARRRKKMKSFSLLVRPENSFRSRNRHSVKSILNMITTSACILAKLLNRIIMRMYRHV